MVIKKPLGSTGIDVSVLGLGTVKFGRNQGMKYPTAYDLPSDAQIDTLITYAKDHGINLIDTAAAYGSSEERLGQALRGQRKDWVIVSKAGEEFVNGQSIFDFSPKQLEYSLHRSLKALQTDYLDVLLLHSDGYDLQHITQDFVFETLAQFKQQGLIRAFGMSTKTPYGSMNTVLNADVVMLTYNMKDRTETSTLDLACQQNKGVLIKKAFVSGHLDQLQSDNPVEESLRFCLKHPGVSSVITGTINPQHLAENIKAVEKIFESKK